MHAINTVRGRITSHGRALAEELSGDVEAFLLAFGSLPWGDRPHWSDCERVLSLIHRDAVTYHRLQEMSCNVENFNAEHREQQIEQRVTDRAALLGFGAIFTGDPRGYCVRLMLPSRRHNTWGGEESGWGVG